jgi:hypothetical protein
MTPEVMVTTFGQKYQSSDKAFELGKARQGSMSIKIRPWSFRFLLGQH